MRWSGCECIYIIVSIVWAVDSPTGGGERGDGIFRVLYVPPNQHNCELYKRVLYSRKNKLYITYNVNIKACDPVS